MHTSTEHGSKKDEWSESTNAHLGLENNLVFFARFRAADYRRLLRQQGRSRSQFRSPAASTPVRTEAFTDVRGTQWIPLSQVADTLGLRALETDSSARIGYTDVMFEVQPSQRHAVSFGKPVSLPQAPIRQNGELYMTTASVSALLQSKAVVDPLSGRLNIGPINADGGVAEKNPQIGESNRYGILGVAEHRDEMVAYAKSF